jgi:hypothetical protein
MKLSAIGYERERKREKGEERDVLKTSNDVGSYIRMAKERRDGGARPKV